MNDDKAGAGKYVASTSNRNFRVAKARFAQLIDESDHGRGRGGQWPRGGCRELL
ncbi:MAG: hypothetical protein R2867_29900 [Caldilineaceae bacterium]